MDVKVTHSGKENKNAQSGMVLKSNLRAGYSCPPGWWKERWGKRKMCCHWVWEPGMGYRVECTS